jgi:STE24 endopeptidase
MAAALTDFSPEEVERARRYHRPLYLALAVDVGLAIGVAAMFAFGPPGDELAAAVESLSWWEQALVFGAAVVLGQTAVRLPLAFWRGFVRERRYGFVTQSAAGWLADRAKGLGVGLVLTVVPAAGLVGIARSFPSVWPVVAAGVAAGFVALVSFVAPVLLEPIFNRFRPLEDDALASDLRSLSRRAEVPVRDVLVADASRRSRKENAYVSGIGATRRVVLYDTLLARASRRELRLITAHELAHRREQHVAKGTALAALAAAAGVVALWALLSWPALLGAIGASNAGDARAVPFVIFAAAVLELLALPWTAALSRRWERVADRGSLELTGDVEAFEQTFSALARVNLSDLDPPRLVYLLLFTHPTPPERLAAARVWLTRGRRPATVAPSGPRREEDER